MRGVRGLDLGFGVCRWFFGIEGFQVYGLEFGVQGLSFGV